MRQVINKLIPEEDLYGAVEAAYSQGWRRMKLYFLTGLPTETDEDTLGIAELARNVVDIGRRYTKQASRSRCRSAGSCRSRTRRSSGSARTPSRSCSRKIGLLRDDARKRPRRAAEVARPRGDVRRRARQPRRPPHRSGHRGRSGAAAGCSRSGASTSTSTAGSTRWPADGLSTRLVRAPPPHRGRGPPVGPHLGRSPQGLPVAGLAATRSPRSASPIAGGRRATTAGRAPATASSTSWPRPRRPPAAARAPARTWPAVRAGAPMPGAARWGGAR